MVVAQPAGETELLADGHRAFAEDGDLVELVAEVGEEQAVLRRAQSARVDAGRVLEPDRQQVLAVNAPGVAVEAAEDPLDTVLEAGEAELLREDLRGSGVVERRVEGVDAWPQAEVSTGDAGGQRGPVARSGRGRLPGGGGGRRRAAPSTRPRRPPPSWERARPSRTTDSRRRSPSTEHSACSCRPPSDPSHCRSSTPAPDDGSSRRTSSRRAKDACRRRADIRATPCQEWWGCLATPRRRAGTAVSRESEERVAVSARPRRCPRPRCRRRRRPSRPRPPRSGPPPRPPARRLAPLPWLLRRRSPSPRTHLA